MILLHVFINVHTTKWTKTTYKPSNIFYEYIRGFGKTGRLCCKIFIYGHSAITQIFLLLKKGEMFICHLTHTLHYLYEMMEFTENNYRLWIR